MQEPSLPQPQIFDRAFKRLVQSSSSQAVVRFINGLFGKNYPPDSSLTYYRTESVKKNLSRIGSDTVLVVGGTDRYVIEEQTHDDGDMAWRILDYSWHAATREAVGGTPDATLTLPAAVVIYLEHTGQTPETLNIKLAAPDGGTLEYKVPVVKLLSYSIEELEARQLTLLLPFCVLKPRRRLARAGTKEERLRLAAELKETIDSAVETLQRGVANGILTGGDHDTALDILNRLYGYLYKDCAELKGANQMVEKVWVTRMEEAEKVWVTRIEKAEKAWGARMKTAAKAATEKTRLRDQKEFARKLIQEKWATEKIATTVGLKPADVESLRRKIRGARQP